MSGFAGAGRPLVSAIVVAMRGGEALDGALRSVVEQDYRPLEVVLFGNGGPIPAPEFLQDAGIALRVGDSPENLGVAGGRNAAARLATGDVLLFLDDDAVLGRDALERAVDALTAQPDVGAVAFRIVDPVTDAPALWYYPYDRETWSAKPFQAPWVIGCGNVIWRSDFVALGGFWDGYFREVEELDLSWRLIDSGRTIRYEPGAAVVHEERTRSHLRYAVASNLLLFWRLFPPGLAARRTLLTVPLWGVRAIRDGEVKSFGLGLRDAVAGMPRAWRERRPLRPATIRYLRQVHAPQSLGKRVQWSLRPLAAPAPAGGQPRAQDLSR